VGLGATARERAIGSLEDREVFIIYRRRAGITQLDLAERAGVRQPLISWWEKGRIELSEDAVEALWDAAEALASERGQEQVA